MFVKSADEQLPTNSELLPANQGNIVETLPANQRNIDESAKTASVLVLFALLSDLQIILHGQNAMLIGFPCRFVV